MLINIIFSIIILVCLAILGFVVYKKLPQLSNLDVETLPQEKFARKKREIVSRRTQDSSRLFGKKLGQKLRPIDRFWRELQLKFRIYVGKIERLMHHEEMQKTKQEHSALTQEERTEKLNTLLRTGEQNLQLHNWEQAEQAFIAAIKLDAKLAGAYRGLGETYLGKGAIDEAKQTLDFVLHLEPDNDAVMVKLAEIYEEQNDTEKAIDYYQRAVVANDSLSPRFAHLADLLLKVNHPEVAREAVIQAVELEPQNPKYLDLMIETAILCQDKKLAEDGYQRLRAVNPENSKLFDFKDRINKI